MVISYSHIANATLPSALLRFTSVFGMGTGGAKALSSPHILKPGNFLLSHSECYTTIGTTSFHFCVRYGYRWVQSAIFTKQSLLKIYQTYFPLSFPRQALKPLGRCMVKPLELLVYLSFKYQLLFHSIPIYVLVSNSSYFI